MSPPATPPPSSAHHPDLDLLSAFHEGRLEVAERTPCARHVASCRDCARVLAELDDFAAAEHLTPSAATSEAAAVLTRAVLQQERATPPVQPTLGLGPRRWLAAAGLALFSAGLGAWWGFHRGERPSGAVETVWLAPALVTRNGGPAAVVRPREETRWLHLSGQLSAPPERGAALVATITCAGGPWSFRTELQPDAAGRFVLAVPAHRLPPVCLLQVTVLFPAGLTATWVADPDLGPGAVP